MTFTRFLSRLLLVVLVVLTARPTIVHAQHTPDDVAIARRLIGTWRLVSHPYRFADGRSVQSRYSVGYIIYTDTSPVHMCFVGMDPNQSASAPATDAEAAGNAPYCSTVEVHAKDGFVLHHVEVSTIPNSVGMTRRRYFTFDGPDRVTLRVDPAELPPPFVDVMLVWERVK